MNRKELAELISEQLAEQFGLNEDKIEYDPRIKKLVSIIKRYTGEFRIIKDATNGKHIKFYASSLDGEIFKQMYTVTRGFSIMAIGIDKWSLAVHEPVN